MYGRMGGKGERREIKNEDDEWQKGERREEIEGEESA